jgi:hypothetical protein
MSKPGRIDSQHQDSYQISVQIESSIPDEAKNSVDHKILRLNNRMFHPDTLPFTQLGPNLFGLQITKNQY